MAAFKTAGKRRPAHRANPKSSATPVRQDTRLLYTDHGQGGVRGTRAPGRFVFRY